MPKPTQLGRQDAQKRVSAASEHLRALARHAPGSNWTRRNDPDGSVTWIAGDGEEILTAHGMWAAPLADYIDAMHPHVGVGFAEILWQLGIGKDPLTTAAGVADQLLRGQRPASDRQASDGP